MVEPKRSRGKRVEVPENDVKQIVNMVNEGMSYSDISEATGYARWTVGLVIKGARARGDLPPSSRGPRRRTGHVRQPVGRDTREDVEYDPELMSRSAAELSVILSAATDEAKSRLAALESVAIELERLWQMAERVATQEQALAQAQSAIRVLERRARGYKMRVEELEAQNIQRALVVHSESSRIVNERQP